MTKAYGRSIACTTLKSSSCLTSHNRPPATSFQGSALERTELVALPHPSNPVISSTADGGEQRHYYSSTDSRALRPMNSTLWRAWSFVLRLHQKPVESDYGRAKGAVRSKAEPWNERCLPSGVSVRAVRYNAVRA